MSPRTWYKGSFSAFAPIWVSDPMGNCLIYPRGLMGHILFPIAEFMTQLVNDLMLEADPTFIPHCPIGFDGSMRYQPAKLNRMLEKLEERDGTIARL